MDGNEKKQKVLIIDDDEGIRNLLASVCTSVALDTRSLDDGSAVMETVRDWSPDLILIDAMMPVRNGYDITEELRSDTDFNSIPIIMLTGLKSREDRLKGIRSGANDFLTKPVDTEELILRLKNNLKIKEYSDFLGSMNEILENQVKERTHQIHESHIDTIYRLAYVSEYKDEDTGAHIQRISYYARELAMELGQSQEFCDEIFNAASMHDIGKVGIPDRIMQKQGGLDENEWEIMKSHTLLGAQILAGSTSPYLQMGMNIALHHHERWDGTGYPRGKKGNAIPLAARIISIADQYDALRSLRPYKAPIDHEQTVGILMNGDGRTRPEHFDPKVHQAFSRISDRFAEIHSGIRDEKPSSRRQSPIVDLAS